MEVTNDDSTVNLFCADTSSEEKRHIKKSTRHFMTASGDRKDQVGNNNQTAAALIPESGASKNSSITQESVQNKTDSSVIDNTVDTGLANQTLAAAVASPAKNETSLGSALTPSNNTLAAEQPVPIADNNTVSESESPSNDTTPALTTMVDGADKPANETSNNLKKIENGENVTVTSNCTTPECACQKSCYPKLVASVSTYFLKRLGMNLVWYFKLPCYMSKNVICYTVETSVKKL